MLRGDQDKDCEAQRIDAGLLVEACADTLQFKLPAARQPGHRQLATREWRTGD